MKGPRRGFTGTASFLTQMFKLPEGWTWPSSSALSPALDQQRLENMQRQKPASAFPCVFYLHNHFEFLSIAVRYRQHKEFSLGLHICTLRSTLVERLPNSKESVAARARTKVFCPPGPVQFPLNHSPLMH